MSYKDESAKALSSSDLKLLTVKPLCKSEL